MQLYIISYLLLKDVQQATNIMITYLQSDLTAIHQNILNMFPNMFKLVSVVYLERERERERESKRAQRYRGLETRRKHNQSRA